MDTEESIDLSSLSAGPFISGTSHAILRLGQPPVPAAQTRKARVTDAGEKPAKKPKTEPGKKGKAATTIADLIDAGLIAPGRNKLTVIYKGITYLASLQDDGTIVYQGEEFGSPSSFSMHVKRFQTPGKQGDDGWKSVTYEGQPLEQLRRQLTAGPAATKKGAPAGPAGGQGSATDQWVQCDRCRTWRVVPPEQWPAVEADSRDDWLCDYATWDVAKFSPFQPACKV